MEYPMLAVFALLPLGLLSLLCKGNHRNTAGFAFVAALAPLVISGVQALLRRKSTNKAADAAEVAAATKHKQEEEQRQQAFDANESSPDTQMNRAMANMRLGRLAGKMGGMDKIPPALRSALQAGYAKGTYTPGSTYVAPQVQRSGTADLIGAGIDAASTVNWGALGGGGASADNGGAARAVAAGGGLSRGFTAPAPISPVNDLLRKRGGI